MRITNSIITSNTKANINLNKVNEDKLNTMVASGQKITRPSDDPVIAIRALRLNSTRETLNQYYEKNIPDASAWFKATETALTQTDTVMTSIRSLLTQGASDDNTAEDRTNILSQLTKLRDQIYAAGNAEYADRTVFTGYRTGEMLTFLEDKTEYKYSITEPLTQDDVESISYISGIQDVNKNSLDPYAEEDITSNEIYRMRLVYENLDLTEGSTVTMNYIPDGGKDPGDITAITLKIASISEKTQEEKDKIYLGEDPGYPCIIKETGEVLFDKSTFETLSKAESIEITYEKSEWKKNDLRPEHYFKCSGPSPVPDEHEAIVDFNQDLKRGETAHQKIEYEIAFNQHIQINTNAADVYKHDIGRDIDELLVATRAVVEADDKISKAKATMNKYEEGTDDYNKAQLIVAAATKERDLLKDKMQKMFSASIGTFSGYQETLNDEIARVGSMRERLKLTENRVSEQRQNFKELSDQNINIDLTEAAIDLTSAETALQAAQLAASKISQQSLLNYL